MNEIKRVAIYCRVSTEEQASEGYSITAQLQTLRNYAGLYGWQVVKEYVDEGVSGKNISGRPAMQQLVVDVEKDEFDAVLVWKISRLSRNMLDTLTVLDKFEENSVKFISYSENFDTGSPIGRLVVQLMASIAEMERNTLSENVKLGMKQRALEGSWNGGVVFGYDSVKKELVINEKEAKVVQLIYELYLSGKGLKAIANHLNKHGYRTKRNRYFSINGVAQILDNPIYVGKISWLKVENWDTKRRKGKNPNPILVNGKHEAIITEELWHLVQARRKSKSFKQRQSNEPFLLSSLLRCPDCGQGMVPSITTYTRKDGTKRKHRYYVCSDFHNKGSSACRSNGIKAYEAENQVFKRILNFLANREYFVSTIHSLNKQSVQSISELKRDLEQTEKKLIDIQQLQEKYLEAFEQNLFPVAILQERLQQVAKEKTQLEQKKNELSTQLSSSDTKVIPPELVRLLLEKFVEVYNHSSREGKKQLLQLLIGSISIRQTESRSRTIHEVNLDFDFTEVNISKTFTLIHLLYRETDKEVAFSQPFPASDNKIPPYLQLFLPLFMVRFSLNNPKPPINLLDQHKFH
ncbi:site-specific DNA recombinase [Sporosarcina newyorkensis 2681]|uniref:Site-specific DNA recombinase n=1 Tax=Sporosarcina newyorkensis 2681 TaxID=1027292 RepID=F9DV07_9BACL|nr:recombinase family protein [Sporosarcina newyorkensis]EGQ23792.1 site-specific DNA recombinase [Sporosarcina newyorkensis 2681]